MPSFCLRRGFVASLTLALGLIGLSPAEPAGAAPRYLVCELKDGSSIYVVIESFGGIGGAVRHCVHYWNGQPRGVVH